MKLKDKVAVVTGGASGIGAALCRRFAEEGARAVVVVDRNEDGAKAVAEEIGGGAMAADVSVEADVINVVNETESRFGRIDLFCSNAGSSSMDGPTAASAPNDAWQSSWEVNLMACVYAARAVLPKMIDRGDCVLEPSEVADCVIDTLDEERFLILPHPEVLTYMQRKMSDYDRWLREMQRLRTRFVTARKERE